MKKTIIPIKGMHCRSCEVLIGDALKEIPNVKSVHVSLKNKQAEVYSKGPLDREKVEAAVAEAGYSVGGDGPKPWFSHKEEDYIDLALAFAILFMLYIVLKRADLFNFNVGSPESAADLVVVLLIGLTAGVSTCMALVGGLVLGISARHAEKHPEATPFQKFRPHVFFNIGRLFSYVLLGGAIGLLGQAFQISSLGLGLMTMGVGVVMLMLGLQLIEIFPRLSNGLLTLPSGISRALGIKKHHEREYSHGNSMLVGALTFFLPCGFTQAMQLFAMSTGSFTAGALIMGTFALGTAPGLLGIGGLTSVIKGAFAKKFFKFAGLIVIGLAFFNLSNGYNLTGWTRPEWLDFSASSENQGGAVELKDGVQIVEMEQARFGYSPNEFTITRGVPVQWIVTSIDSNTCASSLVVPDLNIQRQLQPGENVIEFTPTETGDLNFSCSMGMYRGVFHVEEVSVSESSEAEFSSDNAENRTTISVDETVETSAEAEVVQESTLLDTGVQLLRTTYASLADDIQPYDFTVKAGQPVRFEVDVQVEGQGCMGSIMIPGLADEPQWLEEGKTVAFDFTPTEKGNYLITCAMGIPRGQIVVQ